MLPHPMSMNTGKGNSIMCLKKRSRLRRILSPKSLCRPNSIQLTHLPTYKHTSPVLRGASIQKRRARLHQPGNYTSFRLISRSVVSLATQLKKLDLLEFQMPVPKPHLSQNLCFALGLLGVSVLST